MKPASPVIVSTTTAIQAAIGAGLAASVLSLVTVPPALAALCSVLSPLPIMVVAMAIGWIPGLAASVIASAIVALFTVQNSGLGFGHPEIVVTGFVLYALNLALPALLLARLMALAPVTGTVVPGRDLTIVITTGILACIIVLSVDFGVVIIASGGLTALMEILTQRLDTFYASAVAADHALPPVPDRVAMIKAIPIAAVSMWMCIAGLNTWLAARLSRALGLFAVPWPDMPRCFRIPRVLALVFAAALGLTFVDGIVGFFALIASGALTLAFTAQGLALLHEITRGKSYRLPLLIIVYLLLPSLFPVYALAGLADACFGLRDRFQAKVAALF